MTRTETERVIRNINYVFNYIKEYEKTGKGDREIYFYYKTEHIHKLLNELNHMKIKENIKNENNRKRTM